MPSVDWLACAPKDRVHQAPVLFCDARVLRSACSAELHVPANMELHCTTCV